ncbi:MAG: DUF4397 domain-containing protein [Bacteroidales bacterium]|nr:DUF4397 domain-containing protein [Bacteroidales bacterium]
MRRLKQVTKMMAMMVIVVVMFASCQKDEKSYQVRIKNDCELCVLTIPTTRYDLVEVNLNEVEFANVKYGEVSDYQTVKSGKDYTISVKYDMYSYNAETLQWEYDDTYTDEIGTESWTSDENSDKFVMKFTISDLLGGFKPRFETFYEE